jgi:hypothetical protein
MIRKTAHLPEPEATEPSPGDKWPRQRSRARNRVAGRPQLRALVAALLAMSVLCLGFSAPARAADPSVIEFQYTTKIDATPVGGAADTSVHITYRFNTGLAPGEESDTFASYGPLDRVIVQIGDQCVALSGPGTEISVFNNAGNTPEDAYDVRAGVPATTGTSMFGLEFEFFRFLLHDPEATMFTDTSLPSTTGFADAADFEQINFDFLRDRRQVSLVSTDSVPGALRIFDPVTDIGFIKDQVQATNVNTGVKAALVAPLDKAIGYLSDDKLSNDAMAAKEIQKFRDLVNALPGNVISTSDAVLLTRYADKRLSSLPTCS